MPITQKLNSAISQRPYSEKKELIIQNSMYKSARNFVDEFKDWTPKTIEQRANELAQWSVKRWEFYV